MRGRDRQIDPLPDEFASDDEAAEFWDTHSIAHYEDSLEPADADVDLRRRHYEIEVDEETFRALSSSARTQRKPIKQLASEILKQKLSPMRR